MTELYFVEYSPVQKNFHIDLVERSIMCNRQGILNGGAPNHVPIGFAMSYEEADRMVSDFRKLLAEPNLRIAE